MHCIVYKKTIYARTAREIIPPHPWRCSAVFTLHSAPHFSLNTLCRLPMSIISKTHQQLSSRRARILYTTGYSLVTVETYEHILMSLELVNSERRWKCIAHFRYRSNNWSSIVIVAPHLRNRKTLILRHSFRETLLTMTTEVGKNSATTLYRMNFSGYVKHVSLLYLVECLLLHAV